MFSWHLSAKSESSFQLGYILSDSVYSFSLLNSRSNVDNPSSISKLWVKHISICKQHPKKKTFIKWVHLGQKYTHIAAGGTIYALLMLAGLNLRWCITWISWCTVSDLGKMLGVLASARAGQFLHSILISLT